ncbi:MAG: hypothetical protein ACR2QR_00230 [Woeseiaceae bacterium]
MPEFLMQRFLINSLILLAASGGTAFAVAMHTAEAEKTNSICSGLCAEAIAIELVGLPVVIDTSFSEASHDTGSALPVAIDVDWYTDAEAGNSVDQDR